jgi:hypothetical protein
MIVDTCVNAELFLFFLINNDNLIAFLVGLSLELRGLGPKGFGFEVDSTFFLLRHDVAALLII